MPNVGKCPKCKKTVSNVTIEDIKMYVGREARWRGISYLCQSCKTVLGVQMDPIALKADIVAELVRALRKLGQS